MTTYGEVARDLARAVAHLAAQYPSADSPPVTDAVLTGRQTVFDGVKHTVDAITGRGDKPDRPRLADLELDPASAFRSALHHHPRARTSVALSDAMADGHLPGQWGAAAGAALAMTTYRSGWSTLDAGSRWTALGDLADIAHTMTYVDDDLSIRAPAGLLSDRQPRANLRLSAQAARHEARRHGAGRDSDDLGVTYGPRFCPIRRAADIPPAVDRLAAMIRARGPDLTMHEVGAVLGALAHSLQDASSIMQTTAQWSEEPQSLLDMATSADQIQQRLAAVARHRGQVMTIGPVDRELVAQADQLRGAIRSLLIHAGSPEGYERLDAARVATHLVVESGAQLEALFEGLDASHRAGQLLVRAQTAGLPGMGWRVGATLDQPVIARLLSIGNAKALTRQSLNTRLTQLNRSEAKTGGRVFAAESVAAESRGSTGHHLPHRLTP